MRDLPNIFIALITSLITTNAQSTNINNKSSPTLDLYEISENDDKRLTNNDNASFSHHIPISLRQIKSVKSKMTPVKDQGARGTCNSFAAIGLIEFYEGGDLSEQCLSYFSSDEDVGTPNDRIEWALKNGHYRESDCIYDWTDDGRSNIPDLSKAEKVWISDGFIFYPQHRYNALDVIRQSINLGDPITIDVYTAGKAWDDTGIITLPTPHEISISCVIDTKSPKKRCKKHSVVVTGYDDNEEYLEFKNSWGPKWPFEGPLKGSGYGKMSYAYFKKMKVEMAQMVTK